MKKKLISTSRLKLLIIAICLWGATFNMRGQVTVTAQGEINVGEGISKLTDGNLTSKWLDQNSTSWVKFAYTTAQKWNQYEITSGNDAPDRDPKSWTISASNDGVNWTVLDTRIDESWSSVRNSTKSFIFFNTTSYLYYKWDIILNNGSSMIQASEFTFSYKTDINIAPLGIGCVWQNMANTETNNTKATSVGVNDADLNANVSLTNTSANDRFQAVGVTWATAQTNINRVKLYLGANPFSGTQSPVVQTSASGGSVANDWVTVSGWSFTPAYPVNGTGAANNTYIITGPKISASVKGVRVAGQIALTTASLIIKEIQIDGDDTTPPTQPGQPVASNITSKGLTLTWTESTDNLGKVTYEVFRDGNISCGTTNTNSINISQLTPSTLYSFTVVARDLIGLTSTASSAVSVTTTSYVLGSLGYIENFNDNVLTNWTANSYGLSEANGMLKVNPVKSSIWDGFDLKYAASQLDISTVPYVSMKIKSNFDFNIWVAVGNASGKVDNYPLKFSNTGLAGAQEIVASDVFQEYSFDFTGIPISILQSTNNLHFILNPLSRIFGEAPNKEIFIDDIKIGDLAERTPAISNIQDQLFTVQETGTNSRIVKFRNVTDGSTGTNPITITATSSNANVIPNPTVVYTSPASTGSLVLNPNVLTAGESVITVAVSAVNTTPKVMTFKVKVVPNAAPTIKVLPNIIIKKGETINIPIHDINDANTESTQTVTITASSSNTAVVPTVSVSHNADEYVGSLSLTASSSAPTASISTITVTTKDNGGVASGGSDTSISTFTVTVYESVNNKPFFDSIPSKSIKAEVANDQMQISGITDGDNSNQTLSFTANASNNSIITNLSVGAIVNGIATLSFTKTGAEGIATITLTATDNGGNSGNNGNQSFTRTFQVTSIIPPVNGIATNYVPYISDVASSGVRTELTNGSIVFGTDNSTNITGKVLAYNFPSTYFDLKSLTGGKELDISANKRVSFKLKSASTTLSEGKPLAETVITLRLIDNISPSADANSSSGYAVSAIQFRVPNDDTWHDYYLDFTGKFSKIVGGVVKSTDSTRISRIMLDINLTYFKEETVDVIFKDLKLGDKADLPIPAPKATISNIPNQTLYVGDNPKAILLKGISDGSGNKTATLTASSNNATLISSLNIGSVADGTATLNYSVGAGIADSAIVTVIAKNLAVATSIPDTTTFKIFVVDKNLVTTSTVTVDLTTQYQTIAGMGCLLNKENSEEQLRAAKEFNITLMRCTNSGEFEPVNDNSDPNVCDLSKFNRNALPSAAIRNLNENSNCHKFFYTVWTPPYWMKQNKADYPDSDAQWATNNRLKPEMYEEFAEYIVAICKTIKQDAGVELYAISLQNEPTFNEPYVSCQYNGAEFRELLKIVGPRMQAEGLSTRIILSEDVNQMNWVQANVGPTQADPIASNFLGIVACHLYDPDGIKAGGAGATVWNSLLSFTKTTKAEGLWMTETSGFSNIWEGEMIVDYLLGGLIYAPGPFDFAGSIYTSFKNGNISGWTDLDEPQGKKRNDLLGGVFKNFNQYIGAGTVMVNATSSNSEVLSLAFKNTDNSTTAVLLNTSMKPIKVRLAGANVPLLYEKYTTQNASVFVKGDNVTDGTLLLAPRSITTLYHSTSNAAPSIDQPANQNVVLSEGEKVLTLTGIGYGADVVAQNINSVTATSSKANIANVTVLQNSGSTADLKITPMALGTTTITVSVKDDGGIVSGGIDETSISFTVTVTELTGLNDIKKSMITLYPNPTNDMAILNFKDEAVSHVVISDLSGRIVQQQAVPNQANEIKLSIGHLSKGVYFVTVRMKNQSQTIRLIRQ